MSLEHIEVFLVIFSETSETGHVGPWLIWRGMTQLIKCLEKRYRNEKLEIDRRGHDCSLTLITCTFRLRCDQFIGQWRGNKAVRQRSDLLFIATSFWFEESPCAVRTNTAGLERLCTLFVLSTLLVFEHMHAVLSSTLVLCSTVLTTKHCCYE